MDAKDRNFLARANKVSENYKKRIDKIKADLIDLSVTLDLSVSLQSDENISLFIEYFEKENRLERLEKEQAEHQDRVTELKEQAKKTASLNSFCAEANRLAGFNGINFWTKAGKIFTEETPNANFRLPDND